MADGPIDCVVLQFEDGSFHGELVAGLVDLVMQGTVRILDFVLLSRFPDGAARAVEIDELDDDAREPFSELEGEYGGLLSEADLRYAAELISPGALGVVLIWENTWTAPLLEGIGRAHGEVLLNERLSHPSSGRPETTTDPAGFTLPQGRKDSIVIRRSIDRRGRPSLIDPAPEARREGDRVIDQLTALAALRERGILTDEEFAIQKAVVLGSA